MLLTLVLIVAAILAVLLILAALKPATFYIARSLEIAAPASAVFPQVNDLRAVQAWSPWKKLDPAAEYKFSGPAAGLGCMIEWSGNKQIGAGRQTIVESQPDRLVRSRVEFFRPFAGESLAEMHLEEKGGRTTATWSLAGNNPYVARLFCLFVSQDKMLGTPLSEGLLSLKALVESAAKR